MQRVGAAKCPAQFSATFLLPLQAPAPPLLPHSSGRRALPNLPGPSTPVGEPQRWCPACHSSPGVPLRLPRAGRNYAPPHGGLLSFLAAWGLQGLKLASTMRTVPCTPSSGNS